MKPDARTSVYFIIGTVLSVVPATLSVLMYFPLWQEKNVAAVVSGFTLLLLLISGLPLWRLMKRALASPSVWTVWLILFVIFALLSAIANEMKVICFVGFVSNALGAVFFRLAKSRASKIKQGEKV